MSLVRCVQFKCDRCGRLSVTYAEEAQARQRLKKWHLTPLQDSCPHCVARTKAAQSEDRRCAT